MKDSIYRVEIFRSGQHLHTFIRRRSKEWHAAWKALIRQTGDADFCAEDPELHECWQYMGSIWLWGCWQHSFRHRHHPVTRERRYEQVFASEHWRPEHEIPMGPNKKFPVFKPPKPRRPVVHLVDEMDAPFGT